ANPCMANHRFVSHDERLVADDHCPHGQLRLKRHTYFSYQNDIEWGIQASRDLCRDADTAARKRKHDWLLTLVARQSPGEPAAGVSPVLERHFRVVRPSKVPHFVAFTRLENDETDLL